MTSTTTYLQQGLRALSFVQARFPEAILTGGFLRDIAHGLKPKDIDILIPHDETIGCEDIKFDYETTAYPMIGAAEYMEQNEVAHIWDLNAFSYEFPIQIIMLCPGLDPIERAGAHDFGLCQLWHDGEAMGVTRGFAEDFRDKLFTLRHCEDKKEFLRSLRRWDRLKLKFPEHRLVIPEEFQHFLLEAA